MRRARKKVEVEWSGYSSDTGGTFVIYSSPQHGTEPYCGRCAPPYDTERREGGVTRFYRSEPAQDIEVTEKGTTIKEKKAH
jgi:hypothetical protein